MTHKVADRLYRGPRLEDADLHELRDLKINHVISLEYGFADFVAHLFGRPSEEALTERYTINQHTNLFFHTLKCSPIQHPTHGQTVAFLSLVRDILKDPNAVIYFHCKAGVDRTGWMAASFRVVFQNSSVADAIAEWIELGFHRYRFFWWIPAFRKMMADFI
jgi:protein tyrosine/serine phosphatase